MYISIKVKFLFLIITFVLLITPTVLFGGTSCEVPDNGTGTVTLPPGGCEYTSPDEVFMIIDGLPPGTTIELDGILKDFICCQQPCPQCSILLLPGECEGEGGSLGGHVQCFEATLELSVNGTGDLEGFHRTLAVPVFGEMHTGPRNPGDPVQDFASEFDNLSGELFGDPDFCTFRIKWGQANGLQSATGRTTLTELPSGDFAVDSFFDITYQIEFEGCPGSPIDSFVGTTQGTLRIETGFENGYPCRANIENTACEAVTCPNQDQECVPSLVNFDPVSGEIAVLDCECRSDGQCYVDSSNAKPYDCVQPDNGSETVDLPPDCEYTSPYEVYEIIDGLPPGTTIELDGPLENFTNVQRAPGGSLGGQRIIFEAELDWQVTGTGTLAGFNRHIVMPLSGEMHTGPRNPGDPIQAFQTQMVLLQGQVFGDPDFCSLRFLGGINFGLPSPGQTTLTELPSGDFAVDSFFDITYQIEFEGCPGSPLDGLAGTTTATIHIETGSVLAVFPHCEGQCPAGFECIETIVPNPDGTVSISCECLVTECGPLPDGSGCRLYQCEDELKVCTPSTVNYDPAAREVTILDCDCLSDGECYVDYSGVLPVCVQPDNGSGTVDLPPDCDYTSPDEVYEIIDGLPPGTNVELDGPLDNFINVQSTPGGSLGGQIITFDADLAWTVTGTGDLAGFNRSVTMPLSGEMHTGPRNPGDPVQSFPTEMVSLQGELFGDPDFCVLRFTAGSDNGLPSPGQTTLTELPSGDFAVDSFFDITYQIEFTGCPGSPLDGLAGTTTATIRVDTDMGTGLIPHCAGGCDESCDFCEETITNNLDGSIDIDCRCIRSADLNQDGVVSLPDFAIMASQWLRNIP